MAIACQGGGSHTAFTAGVLSRLLREDERSRYEIVGLSGTSGGAVCALLAWSALVDGDPGKAATLLDGFWSDNAATTPGDQLVNAAALWASSLASFGITPAVSPYQTPFAATGLETFRELLRRQVDFEQVRILPSGPMLVIGAVNVLSGEFRTFDSRRDRITADMVIASAAIPTLFRAVGVDGGTYWDGLFSQNPPVRELLDARPDELWVVQINPTRRDTEPRTLDEIADRRNELSGNLSLYQELHVIEKIDALLEEGLLAPDGPYKQVVVRILELPRARLSRLSRALGAASKLNRDPAFLRELWAHGEAQADEFLDAIAFEDAWRARDVERVLGFLAEDAELACAAPFPPFGPTRDPAAVHPFLRERLAEGMSVDATRKQVARDRVTWTVRAAPDPADAGRRMRGRVEVRFHEGRIASLRIGGSN